ncbi:hypothetical protein SCHPADRAFT_938548 [Schizopora paradoxa]|uniref:Uncharacterized protein n=1 Tax=Schizopora paradoxa TaxID=27342 RepID=A0A0H2RV36_9AGAM|nr:hypothetical protein SCHPADRAFT_938548 [Schizopora paradoxa]
MSILRYCRQERIEEVRNDPHYIGRVGLASQLTFVEGGDEGNRLILKSDAASDEPSGAVLRVIGKISRTKHSLRPQGTYNPPKKLKGDNVTKAKLRFLLEPAEDFKSVSLDADFDNFLENLIAIHNDDLKGSKPPTVQRPFDKKKGVTVMHNLVIVRPPSFHLVSDFIDGQNPGCQNLSTKPRQDEGDMINSDIDEDEDEDANITPNILNNSISIENWPVAPDSLWRKELESVKNTHDIFPLQAFNSKGELIHPSDYVRKLAGAVVDMSFTLVHYNFAKVSRMCVFVTEIRVLVSPKPLPGSVTSTRRGIIRK